jgi:hypothetical protein
MAVDVFLIYTHRTTPAPFEIPDLFREHETRSPQPQNFGFLSRVEGLITLSTFWKTPAAANYTQSYCGISLAAHRHQNIAIDLRRHNLESIQQPPGSTLDMTVPLPLPLAADIQHLQTLLLNTPDY